MQSFLGRFAFLSVAILLTSGSPQAIAEPNAPAGDAAISVADLTLNIPAPAGTRAVSKASGVFKAVETALPPMLRLEASFYGISEASDVEAGSKPPSGPFYQVQINKTFENKRFSTADFANVRKSMLKELGDSAKMAAEAEKALGDSSKRIAKSTGVDVKLTPGQSVFMHPHLDETSMLGFSFRMGFQVSGSGNVDIEEEMTGTGIMAHVRGKAVQLYAYYPGSGAEALESSRKTAKEWAAAVIAANPIQPGDEASSFGFDWSRIGDKAMIGAGIGLIAGVLGVLFRKKKTAA